MALHLKVDSLDWALSQVEKHGDTDLFPVPFEFRAIRYCWQPGQGYGEIKSRGLRELLRATDLSAWPLRPQRRCIAPKNQFGFRIATQLDPFDSLLFHAAIYEIGQEIEVARVSVGKGVVHSYRFKPSADGDMFDTAYGYRTFLAETSELVQSGSCNWVVTADIADFYPRVYSHPLENALRVSTTKTQHADALVRFLGQLSQSVSYGLPVGPSGSRLLAELVVSDVDRLLLSEDIKFVRFVDDYRIFCATEKEAYDALAKLANALFENHGLTLQQHKTRIYSKAEYLEEIAPDEEDLERTRLSTEFERIIEDLGLNDPYEPIEYESLELEHRERVDALNLLGILEEQIELGLDANVLTLKFLLRRFAQLSDEGALESLLESPRTLYLVLRSFADYVMSLADIGGEHLGQKLLRLLDDDVLAHLDFNRAWILHPFSERPALDRLGELMRLINANPSQLERRELLLGLGSHGGYDWLGAQRRNFDQETPWCRRAFLAAARCLPGDQAQHWYKAVRPQLDLLEQAVSIWAESLRS